MNRVNLVNSTGRCEAEDLLVQETDHVLAIHAISCLPADVEGPAELIMAKRPYSVARRCIQSLFLLVSVVRSIKRGTFINLIWENKTVL